MENNFFGKDSVSFGSASSALLTDISDKNLSASNNGVYKFNFDIDLNNINNMNKKSFNFFICGNATDSRTMLIKNIVHKLNSKLNLSKIYLYSNLKINDYTDTFSNLNFAQENINFFTDKNINFFEDIIQERKDTFNNKVLLNPILIILDDICYSNNKNEIYDLYKNLFYNAQYLNISIIMAVQYPDKLNSIVINNFDYIFAYTPSHNEIKRLYELYIGNFIDFNKFNLCMSKITRHEFLVINNHNKLFAYYKIENNFPAELLPLSEINNTTSANPVYNKNTAQLIEKLNKNNTLIQKLTDENQKIFKML